MRFNRGRILAGILGTAAITVSAIACDSKNNASPLGQCCPQDSTSKPQLRCPSSHSIDDPDCRLSTPTVVLKDVPSVIAEVPVKPTPPPIVDVPMIALPAVIKPASAPPVTPPPTVVEPVPTLPDVAPLQQNQLPVRSAPDLKPEPAAVKVTLHLGDSKPSFVVSCGTDWVLKVVCKKVDVKSPGEAGTAMSPLSAAGNIRFVAPGCVGTCDSLTLKVETGEIQLSGNVVIRCQQGKSETEFSGSSVRFKIGSSPAVGFQPVGFVTIP